MAGGGFISDRDLEAVAALGWRGLEQERLGGWLLRAAHGFTGRANSALPLDPPDRPLADALAAVRTWYAARDLPAIVQVPLPWAADVDTALARAGWTAYNPTRVLVSPLSELVRHCPPDTGLAPVRHEAAPSPHWLAGYVYRGQPLPDGARSVLVNAEVPTFASVPADASGSQLLGVGRGVVDDGWLGVTAVTVAQTARRRGVARHLMRGLAVWGLDHAATRVYLQVAEDNIAALALYTGLGFRTHHRYQYRRESTRPTA